MGLLHTGILNSFDKIQITSIAEKENLLTKYIKNAIPSANVYGDYNKMIETEDLDLVYITTPSFTHLPIIQSCIKKGNDFFVEKPLTTNLNEAKKVFKDLKNKNIIHAVGYNVRFVDTFFKAKSLLEMKILGEIYDIKSSMFASKIFSKPSGWRYIKKMSGGGVLLEFGSHLIDLLLWYFGSIQRVNGKTQELYTEVEDTAHMNMEFSNTIKGTLDISWSIQGYRIPEINIEIKGDNGYMRINQDFIDIKLKKNIPEFPNTESRIYKQSLNSGVHFDVGGPEYTKEDIHVIECVRKRKLPLVNTFEACKTQSVIQAMYEAASSDEPKEVEYIN